MLKQIQQLTENEVTHMFVMLCIAISMYIANALSYPHEKARLHISKCRQKISKLCIS